MSDRSWYWQRRRNVFKDRLDAEEPAFMVGVDVAWTPLPEVVGGGGGGEEGG
jgi:hypothetical protein